MKKHFRKGQSVLEYTLLLAAIIAVIIVVLGIKGNTGLTGKINTTYENIGDAMKNTTTNMTIGVYNQ